MTDLSDCFRRLQRPTTLLLVGKDGWKWMEMGKQSRFPGVSSVSGLFLEGTEKKENVGKRREVTHGRSWFFFFSLTVPASLAAPELGGRA